MSRDKYVQNHNVLKGLVKGAKSKSWKDSVRHFETLGQQAGKPFWSLIRKVKNRSKKEISFMLRIR